jgi:hypothetical protein
MRWRSLLAVAAGVALAAPPTQASFLIVTSDGHFDIEVHDDNGTLEVALHNHADDSEYGTDEVLFQVGTRRLSTLSNQFGFLGNPGDVVWTVPQTPTPNLPYIGFSGEELEDEQPGVFSGVGLRIEAVRFTGTGPGHFAAWLPGFPSPTLIGSSIAAAGDSNIEIPLAHIHYTLGFNGFGTYEIDVTPFALRNGVYEEGGLATLNFQTVPAPPAAVLGLIGVGVLAGGARLRRRAATA